jgi:non-specific serine/threonine protein kinase
VVLISLGDVVRHQGDHDRAVTLFEESLTLHRDLGHKHGIADGLERLAGAACGQGQWERAARLFGAAEALREAIDVPRPPADRPDLERSLVALRAGLDERALAAAWAEGRALTLEQAVAVALERAPANATVQPGYPAGLTAREVEVLGLVAAGLSDTQVAAKLVISPRTVSTHLTSIYRKLGITLRGEAVRFAVEHRLV